MAYTFIIRNQTDQTCSFYLFQQQPTYTVSNGAPSVIQSSCLCSGEVAPYSSSGSELEFVVDAQVFAGAVSDAITPTGAQTALFTTEVKADDTESLNLAVQPIEIAASSSDDTSADNTSLTLDPLGLSPPFNLADVSEASFGITVPNFDTGSVPGLYCGNAVQIHDGYYVLSSFIQPFPNIQINCAPIPAFYITVGSYAVGEVVPYKITGSNITGITFTGGPDAVITLDYDSGEFTPVVS